MPSVKGTQLTCCRCGRTHFLRWIGKGDADGGYTTWDKYEPTPKTWLYENGDYLCEDCSTEYKRLMNEFYGEKVPSKYKMENNAGGADNGQT